MSSTQEKVKKVAKGVKGQPLVSPTVGTKPTSDPAGRVLREGMTKGAWRLTPHFRLRMKREEKGLTQQQLADKVKGPDGEPITRTAVANWERGHMPRPQKLRQIAEALETSVAFFTDGFTGAPTVVAPDPATLGYVLVPEVVFGEKPTETSEIQVWGVPTKWLQSELNVAGFDNLVIFKVPVQSVGLEYGDRILVDRNVTRPSPAGDFLFWDGYGPALSKIQVMPAMGGGKKALAKLTNGAGTYEMDVDKLQIIGRVRGTWRKA